VSAGKAVVHDFNPKIVLGSCRIPGYDLERRLYVVPPGLGVFKCVSRWLAPPAKLFRRSAAVPIRFSSFSRVACVHSTLISVSAG